MAELEKIVAYGHKKVLGTHKTTIEVTKENSLTERGDCIIAINANKSCFDLDRNVKDFLKAGNKVKFIFEVNGKKDVVTAFGSPKLKLNSRTSMVIRKSDFIDDRTVAIKADKSAKDLDRALIEELKNPNAKLIIIVMK